MKHQAWLVGLAVVWLLVILVWVMQSGEVSVQVSEASSRDAEPTASEPKPAWRPLEETVSVEVVRAVQRQVQWTPEPSGYTLSAVDDGSGQPVEAWWRWATLREGPEGVEWRLGRASETSTLRLESWGRVAVLVGAEGYVPAYASPGELDDPMLRTVHDARAAAARSARARLEADRASAAEIERAVVQAMQGIVTPPAPRELVLRLRRASTVVLTVTDEEGRRLDGDAFMGFGGDLPEFSASTEGGDLSSPLPFWDLQTWADAETAWTSPAWAEGLLEESPMISSSAWIRACRQGAQVRGGEAVFRAVSPAVTWVAARVDGYGERRDEISVLPGESVSVSLTMPLGVRLVGRLLVSGRVAPHGEVGLGQGPIPVEGRPIAEDGSFDLSAASAGTFAATAWEEGRGWALQRRMHPPGASGWVIDLAQECATPTSRGGLDVVRGVVYDASRTPVAHVRVRQQFGFVECPTDAFGRFELWGVDASARDGAIVLQWPGGTQRIQWPRAEDVELIPGD